MVDLDEVELLEDATQLALAVRVAGLMGFTGM